MKTIQQIKKEIDSILSLDRNEMKKREYIKHSKRVSFLNTCLMYIESSPDEQFVLKEITRLQNRIDAIKKQQPAFDLSPYRNSSEEKKLIESYLKEYRVPELNNQLKTLNYILK
jgi:hypothetical protein